MARSEFDREVSGEVDDGCFGGRVAVGAVFAEGGDAEAGDGGGDDYAGGVFCGGVFLEEGGESV